MVPLNQWPRGTRTTSLKYKYHDRKHISVEYLRIGETSFVNKYDPDNCTLKDLKHKIRSEHNRASESQGRTDNDSSSHSSQE